MKLSPVQQKFILHWGEMGSRWGLNRTVAQIHALLFLSPEPLPADVIAETLSVARSNVSTSLKELQNWRLVTPTHVLGDRREHFHAEEDVWEMLTVIAAERKRREIDPTLNILRECLAEAERNDTADPETKRRLEAMLGFVAPLSDWFEDIMSLPRETLFKLLKMGGRVAKVVGRS